MATEPIRKAADLLGGQACLARAIGTSPSMVHQWLRGIRPVAAEWCPRIERATAGAVRCEDLLPEIDWAYLRATGVKQSEAAV